MAKNVWKYRICKNCGHTEENTQGGRGMLQRCTQCKGRIMVSPTEKITTSPNIAEAIKGKLRHISPKGDITMKPDT